MKVVHLITLLEFGGAQGNTIHTVQNLDKTKFETHLWAGRGAFWDKEMESSLDLKGRLRFFPSLKRNLSPVFDLIALFQLKAALRELKPTILHTHSSKAGILGRIAGKMAGVPVIVHTFHGFGFNDRQKPWTRWLFIILEKLTAPLADKLIFVSKDNMHTALRLGIGNRSQYELIRSGVDMKNIRGKTRQPLSNDLLRELNLRPENKLVTTIGPFKPQKNLPDFLELAARISRKMPQVVFLIVGDGELRARLEAKAASLNLSNNLRMPGWRKDAPTLLAASDAFVMTSLWEGLPRALVEAMAIGTPPVCYETDGVRDLLSVEEGTMVRQGDVAGAEKNLEQLLADPIYWKRTADAVKIRVGEEFDIDHMVRQQETLYQSIVDNATIKH